MVNEHSVKRPTGFPMVLKNHSNEIRSNEICIRRDSLYIHHVTPDAAAGEAMIGGNSIRQLVVFLTEKLIFSSISYIIVLFEYMILFIQVWQLCITIPLLELQSFDYDKIIYSKSTLMYEMLLKIGF